MINVIGTLQGTSGYASHLRGVVNELNKLEKVKIVTNLTPGFEREVNDAELEMLKRQQEYDINLIITHPLYWKSNLSAKRNFVYLVWEGDSVPQWIIEECRNNKIEKIIVPSRHTNDALINSTSGHTFEDKVVVIPHGHNPEDFYRLTVWDTWDKKPNTDKFRFLANKGLRNMEDRGGLQYLIKAYSSEFKEGEAELHLKINPAYGIPDFSSLFPDLKGRTDILFYTENLSTKQLNELYNKCDVFVSPTRAEAFNIPCLEAMSCNKPIITTNFGGQTDFCDDSTGIVIGGNLTEITHEIEYEGVKWLTPDNKELRKALRHAFNNQGEMKKRGEIANTRSKKLTWENTAKQIFNLI